MHEISDFSEASEKLWMRKGVFVYILYFPVALTANFIILKSQVWQRLKSLCYLISPLLNVQWSKNRWTSKKMDQRESKWVHPKLIQVNKRKNNAYAHHIKQTKYRNSLIPDILISVIPIKLSHYLKKTPHPRLWEVPTIFPQLIRGP